MRITCPNCAAQYEVDSDLVPEDGRDVQCSSCGHVWVQFSDGSAEEIGAAPYEDDTPPEPEEGRIRRRELDDETRRILREEAEREMSKRRAKRPDLETQSELDLPDSRAAGRKGDAGNAVAKAAHGVSGLRTRSRDDAARAAASRGDLLPDIEEINSSLSAKDERAASGSDDTDDSGSSPFRRGFMAVLSVALLAIALYIAAPAIARNVPSLEGPLSAYVGGVNDLRGGIDAVLERAAVAIDGNT